jgi:putative spermidine/putrescine transport system permease protein
MTKIQSEERRSAALLLGPAVLLFIGIGVAPLLMTILLSFNGWHATTGIDPSISFRNYADILSDGYFAQIFLRTLWIATATTVICILIGAPEAYVLRRMSQPWRSIFLMVIITPLLISVIARTLGWAMLLNGNGLVSTALQGAGLSSRPVSLMFTQTGVIIALVHVLVPFMVLSVWSALSRMDRSAEGAALSLGASQFTVFRRIVLPQALPGILSGAVIVFTLAASAFATPAIIGGRRLKVVATEAYDEFLHSLNWPLGAAIAVLLLIGIVTVVVGCNRWIERRYATVFQ